MYRLSLFAAPLLAALVLAGCGSSNGPTDIAFVSSRDGDYAIYGMATDGSHQRRLTKEEGDPASPSGLYFQTEPAWSPDGSEIAFSSRRDGPSYVFVMNADGSGTHRLTTGLADEANPAWSPDGAKIVYERGNPARLYVVDSGGASPRKVTPEVVDETAPAWSSDGRWIAYSRRTPGTSVWEIWLVHPDGTSARELTHLGASSRSPAWSPDGKTIAFSSDKVLNIPVIYTVTSGGKSPRPLTGAATTGAFEPSWSPDGKTIAFWSDGVIYTVPLGGNPKAITSDQNDSSPVWRPTQSKKSSY